MPTSPCRILIVDDDSDNAASLKVVLTLKGFDAECVLDAHSALSLPHDPHVLLLDLGLPYMDGCEVARRLKAQAPHLFIIAVTGHQGEQVKDRAREAGIDMYMLKPLNLELLFQTLEEARSAPVG
jgi:DNA-binding response OmpR family regulator